MDLHALSQGRSMLAVRGCVAAAVGLVLTNNSELSTATVLVLVGLGTVLEGAALVWQSRPATRPGRTSVAHPALQVLGGVAIVVGVVTTLGLGLSTTVLVWLLAAWFVVRAAVQVVAAASRVSDRARLLLGLSAVADLGLVALFLTHTGGDLELVALVGGAVLTVWAVLQMFLGSAAARNREREESGPRLLAHR